jgi:multidrug resistance protein MdtO
LILNIGMVVLISLIITSVVLVAIIVIDEPVWCVASMAAISLGLLFLASASKLRPVGGIVALIVAYALDLLGTVHGGEIATRALLYAWLFIGIPAGYQWVLTCCRRGKRRVDVAIHHIDQSKNFEARCRSLA